MQTDSTTALYDGLRTAILDYTDESFAAPLSGVVTDLYHITAPDNAAAPYGILTIKTPQRGDGESRLKMAADIEVMWFGRPRKNQAAIEAIGDQTVAALSTLRSSTDGLAYATGATSEPLPAFKVPADRELVQVRVVARLHAWPTFLSRLST